MARREITQYYDDLDQSPLTESELKIVEFSYDGTDYILDLSEDNFRRFEDALNPFVKAAREVKRESTVKVDASDVRAWAKKQGMNVSNRGKIPFEIQDAYRQAHV